MTSFALRCFLTFDADTYRRLLLLLRLLAIKLEADIVQIRPLKSAAEQPASQPVSQSVGFAATASRAGSAGAQSPPIRPQPAPGGLTSEPGIAADGLYHRLTQVHSAPQSDRALWSWARKRSTSASRLMNTGGHIAAIYSDVVAAVVAIWI